MKLFIKIFITCDVMVTKLNIHIDFKSTGMLYGLEMYNIVSFINFSMMNDFEEKHFAFGLCSIFNVSTYFYK